MKEKVICLANATICTAATVAVSNCNITPELGAVILIPAGLIMCQSFIKTDWCDSDTKKSACRHGTAEQTQIKETYKDYNMNS